VSLEILALNMERGIRLDAWVTFLEARRPDILLASELDIGCDRSGKLDVPAELARRLGLHYVFAEEFRELTQGGSHGNAIFSRYPIKWAKTVTLPREYDWFFDVQKRTGDRCALLAQLDVGGKALGVGSIHLENRTGPEGRVRQLRTVLEEAERLFPHCPIVLGGDLNTNGFDGRDKALIQKLSEDPSLHREYLEQVFQREPCLSLATEYGYRILPENGGITRRKELPGRAPLTLRLDWLLVKGVSVTGSGILSTKVGSLTLSDHDGVRARIIKQLTGTAV